MINIISCLAITAVSGAAMGNGFRFEGVLGFIISAIFIIGMLTKSSKEGIERG